MKKNVGYLERAARVAAGAALLFTAENRYVKAFGALTAAEGLAGYCFFYDLLGIDTREGN